MDTQGFVQLIKVNYILICQSREINLDLLSPNSPWVLLLMGYSHFLLLSNKGLTNLERTKEQV